MPKVTMPIIKLPSGPGNKRLTPIAKAPHIIVKTPPLAKPKSIFK